jgi:hypothetical protein
MKGKSAAHVAGKAEAPLPALRATSPICAKEQSTAKIGEEVPRCSGGARMKVSVSGQMRVPYPISRLR